MNKQLYNEMKKLSKRANQRILNIERLTGTTDILSVKELKEKLTIEQLKNTSWTKSNRVAVKSYLNDTQMIAQIKALKEFLEPVIAKPLSTVGEIKKYKSFIESSIGRKITYKQIDTVYQSSKLYDWATETYGSKFWKELAPKVYTMEKMEWVDLLDSMQEKINDITIKNKLKVLYDLLKG